MSSPISIHRTTSSASTSSSSPTGLYVPVHKRNASTASSSPSQSVAPTRVKRVESPSITAVAPSIVARSISPIPSQYKIPSIYSITDLLYLSSSPLAQISSAQREHIDQHILTIVPRTGVAADKQAPRRRRAGRKGSTGKKLAANANADVESRRRQRGTWGWQEHVALSEGAATEKFHGRLEDDWRAMRSAKSV